MKKILLPFLLILLGLPGFTQKISTEEVPLPVQQASVTRIPDSVNVQWFHRDSLYLAEFEHKGMKAQASFTGNAEWLYTRWDLPVEYLTKKITTYLAEQFPGYKILHCMIEYKGGGEYYLVAVKKKKDKPVLRFNIKSVFMMKE